MSNYEIKILESDQFLQWDEFVKNSPQGTLFSSSKWLTAAGDTHIYGVFQKDRLVAGLPINVRKLPFGMLSAEHPPLTPYLGVLHEPGESKYVKKITREKEIHRALSQVLKSEFTLVRFNFFPGDVDLQPFVWGGYLSAIRYTYWLDIRDLDRVWDDMEKRRRNDIARAERDQITVKRSTDFEQIFSLVEKTFERQQMTASFRVSAERYHQVQLSENSCMGFIAHDADENAIAVVYLVWDHRRAYYLLGGYDPEKGHTGASALAMWQAIQYASRELGLAQFDFEGSMVPAVEQFFRKFGGQLVPYQSISWLAPHLELAINLKNGISKLIKGIFRR